VKTMSDIRIRLRKLIKSLLLAIETYEKTIGTDNINPERKLNIIHLREHLVIPENKLSSYSHRTCESLALYVVNYLNDKENYKNGIKKHSRFSESILQVIAKHCPIVYQNVAAKQGDSSYPAHVDVLVDTLDLMVASIGPALADVKHYKNLLAEALARQEQTQATLKNLSALVESDNADLDAEDETISIKPEVCSKIIDAVKNLKEIIAAGRAQINALQEKINNLELSNTYLQVNLEKKNQLIEDLTVEVNRVDHPPERKQEGLTPVNSRRDSDGHHPFFSRSPRTSSLTPLPNSIVRSTSSTLLLTVGSDEKYRPA
jgi:hypothetical protein